MFIFIYVIIAGSGSCPLPANGMVLVPFPQSPSAWRASQAATATMAS